MLLGCFLPLIRLSNILRMKIPLLLLLSLNNMMACNLPQKDKREAKQAADSGIYIYRFKNKYLDINKLKLLDTIPGKNFTEVKREEIYAPFFTDPADSIFFKNRVYKLTEHGDIVVSENGKQVKIISNTDKKIPFDNVEGNSIIFSVPDGIIHVLRLTEKEGYHVKKYDADGNLLNEWKIPHTLFKKITDGFESVPYLYYLGHTNRELIFSSLYDKPDTTVILNLTNGKIRTMNYPASGFISNANNDSIAGVVYYDDSAKKFRVEINNRTWQTDNPEDNNSTRAVLKDSVLVLAEYPNISSGCDVNAYNAYTGKLLWKGDVIQMNIGHSEYYNTVYLTLFRDKLILEGIEAGGTYLQVLDFKTGKRLFQAMP
jgi:hypothetical protein